MSQITHFAPIPVGLIDADFEKECLAASVILAAGGKVVGRIRMQKLVFLLDQLGLDSGFEYTYHHFGPYSSDLADTLDFARVFGLIKEEKENRASDHAAYSIYSVGPNLINEQKNEFLTYDKAKNAIENINHQTSTVLELAATAYWLKFFEKVDDWKAEIIRRKGRKTDGRLDKAEGLLNRIGLQLS